MSRITIGNALQKLEDDLEKGESIQFLDVEGSPRVSVSPTGALEILFNTGGRKRLCVIPVVGNMVEIGLK